MSHRIERADYTSLTEEDIVALNDFENALKAESRPEDPPTPLERTRASVLNMPADIVINEFWIRDDSGAIIAMSYAVWRDIPENRELAQIDVTVSAEHRGRGLARELLAPAVEACRADGRILIAGNTSDRVPSGGAFAERLGAKIAQRFHTNRLLISDVDPATVERWIADGPIRAPGYSLVSFDGPLPDDVMENALDALAIMNTAPLDDMQRDYVRLTAEQMRAIEKQGVAEGTERWFVFAREDSTGAFVGLTELFWNPAAPKTANQGDTGVHPDHRGNALGKWLKATTLERLMRERPMVEEIRTGNADSNDAMLGINRALGFKHYIAQYVWEVPLASVEAYLGASV